jgi:hypothetical protein
MLIYQKQAHLFPTLNLAIIGTDPTRYLVEQISQERGVFQQIMLNIAKWHLFYWNNIVSQQNSIATHVLDK